MKSDDGKYQNLTCYTLASLKDLTKYGVEKCPALDCKPSVVCNDWRYVYNKNPVNVKDSQFSSGVLEDYCT